jgi:lysozyme
MKIFMMTLDRHRRPSSRVTVGLSFALAFATACGEAPVREDELGELAETEDAIRACPGSATVEGIDVSHWQGTIDWSTVAATGKRFAIFKATEGTTYVDDTFAQNWQGSKRAGLIRGAYHYFRPARDPIAQANFFADVMGPLGPGDLPPMLDLEETDGLSPSRVAAATRRFLDHLQLRTGRVPMIYTGYYFWRDQVGNPSGFSHYPLVMAAYVRGCPLVPDSWGRFTMWQYSSTGRVGGIRGNVDLDVFDGDMNALVALAQGTVQTPTPTPTPEPQPPSSTPCGVATGTRVLGHDQGIASCDGRYFFVHQGDGNVVLYTSSGRALWSTRTHGRATESLVMQGDGNLVLYAPGGRAIWSTGTHGNPGAFLAVQDDGNVVIYRPTGRALWATGTNR